MKKLIYILPIISLLVSCTSSNDQTTESEAAVISNHKPLQPDTLIKATRELAFHEIHATGSVDVPPTHKIGFYAPYRAFVHQVKVLPGSHVEKGEQLAVLQHPDLISLQEEYLLAVNNLNVMEKDYKRKEKLIADEAVSQKQFDQVENYYLNQKVKTDALSSKLEFVGISTNYIQKNGIMKTIPIYAKQSGIVTNVYVHEGVLVKAEEPILEFADMSHPHLEISVYAKDLNHLKEGDPVAYTVSGSDRIYTAHIHLISPQIDSDTRTSKVHAHFDDEEDTPPLGSYGEAIVYTEGDTVYTLPNEAFITRDDLTLVITKGENGYKYTPVETGLTTAHSKEVTSIREIVKEEFGVIH